MMRLLFLAAALAIASPASAQHAMPDMQAADPACPPEHAAMGHCKSSAFPVPPAAPGPAPVDPKCPPEHAALGHCKPALPPPQEQPPAPDPACPPKHAAMGHCKPRTGEPSQAGPSPAALGGAENAADTVWGAQAMAPARRAIYAEHGTFRGGELMFDRLEYEALDGRDGYAWEGEAWYGGDYDRLWLKTEGEGGFGGRLEDAEVQALWSRALGPWFDLQAGVRQDVGAGPDRTHLVVGVQGLAPYLFEVDAAAFLSSHGDLTARLEADYDLRITNRLILQPRVQADLSAQDVPALGIGSGLSSVEAGLRLRYEVAPEFAPYLGVEYRRDLGDTADFTRKTGEGGWAFVAGLRGWF